MINKKEKLFFQIRESQTKKTPTSTTNIQAILGKEGTESTIYRRILPINVFFASLDLKSMNKGSSFSKIIWAISVNLLVLRRVLILFCNRSSQLQSTLKWILNFS